MLSVRQARQAVGSLQKELLSQGLRVKNLDQSATLLNPEVGEVCEPLLCRFSSFCKDLLFL